MWRSKTVFISGASRGIGKAIAIRLASEGANIAIVAKTAKPHPILPGTIFTAAEECQRVGGNALPIVCDIRDEKQVQDAVKATVDKFGGIDVVINNASAISLTDTASTDLKKYDLMNSVNARGTWMVTKFSLPYLKKSAEARRNPHVLMISPPLSMKKKWFQNHTAYTIAKYGMSMCVLGMSGEFEKYGIAVNALWPKTCIDTDALNVIDKNIKKVSRTTEIMSDAAYVVLSQPTSYTGIFAVDEDILRSQGVTNFDKYAAVPGNKRFAPDFFLDENYSFPKPGIVSKL